MTNSIVSIEENQLLAVVFYLCLHRVFQFSDQKPDNLQNSETGDVFAHRLPTESIPDTTILASGSTTFDLETQSRESLFTEKSSKFECDYSVHSALASRNLFIVQPNQRVNPHDLFARLAKQPKDELTKRRVKMEESGSAHKKSTCFSAGHLNQYSSKTNGKQIKSIRRTI